jgi:hypothetical protein
MGFSLKRVSISGGLLCFVQVERKLWYEKGVIRVKGAGKRDGDFWKGLSCITNTLKVELELGI